MDKAIYTAISGISQAMFKQQVIANNLANVGSDGFRGDYATVISKNVSGDGLPTRVMSEVVGVWSSEQPGHITHTGRTLDVAIAGAGWLAVEDTGGNEAYTRGGSLQVNAEGTLTTSHGDPVLDESGAMITLPLFKQMQIGSDGSISIQGLADPDSQLVTIGRLKLATSQSPLQKNVNGLFYVTGNPLAATNEAVKLESGALESSNVNPMQEMTEFISLGRQFEIQLKTIETARQMAESGDRLIRGT